MKWISFRNSATLSILVSNLLLLIATIIFKWDGLSVFVLYIIETVIIGFYHAIKLMVLAAFNKPKNLGIEGAPSIIGALFMVLFFIFHFGFFVFVQTMLILPSKSNNFIQTFTSIGNYIGGNNRWLIISFFVINLFALIKYIFIDESFQGKDYNKIMMEPYPRIFVQQFVVIIGSVILMALGSSLFFVLFFILIKTLIELNVDLFGKKVK